MLANITIIDEEVSKGQQRYYFNLHWWQSYHLAPAAVGSAAEKPQPEKEGKKVVKTWRVTQDGLEELTTGEVQKLHDEVALNEQKREAARRNFIANKVYLQFI